MTPEFGSKISYIISVPKILIIINTAIESYNVTVPRCIVCAASCNDTPAGTPRRWQQLRGEI